MKLLMIVMLHSKATVKILYGLYRRLLNSLNIFSCLKFLAISVISFSLSFLTWQLLFPFKALKSSVSTKLYPSVSLKDISCLVIKWTCRNIGTFRGLVINHPNSYFILFLIKSVWNFTISKYRQWKAAKNDYKPNITIVSDKWHTWYSP